MNSSNNMICKYPVCTAKEHGESCENVVKAYYSMKNAGYVCPKCSVIDEDWTTFTSNHLSHAGLFTKKKASYQMKCQHFPLYCSSKSHNREQICMEIMNKYYWTINGFLCPHCEVIEKDWKDFCSLHKHHAEGFLISKASMIDKIMSDKTMTTLDQQPLQVDTDNTEIVDNTIIENTDILMKEESQSTQRLLRKSKNGVFQIWRVTTADNLVRVDDFLRRSWPDIRRVVEKSKHPVKVCFCLKLTFDPVVKKSTLDTKDVYFHVDAIRDVNLERSIVMEKLLSKINAFHERGSNFIISNVHWIDLKLIRYEPIALKVGHAHFELPATLKNKRAVVNVKNTDSNCFKYAVLSLLKKDEIDSKARNKVSSYRDCINDVNWNGIQMPMTVGQLGLFHSKNPFIGINLLRWDNEDREVKVLKPAPDSKTRNVLNILLVENSKGANHYVGVLNIDRLLNSNACHTNKLFFCHRCLHGFHKKMQLDMHMSLCRKSIIQNVVGPKNETYKFNQWQHTVSPTHVAYADIECALVPQENGDDEHVPTAVGYLLLAKDGVTSTCEGYYSFTGETCIQEFLTHLGKKAEEVRIFNSESTHVSMTNCNEEDFKNAMTCYLCNKSIVNKVHDHDHVSGRYLGAACSHCNLLRREKRSRLPVLFHNGKGYDFHFLIKYGLQYHPNWNFSVIANTSEQYLSMRASIPSDKDEKQTATITFLDSLQFLSTSLSNLVKTATDMPITATLNVSDCVKFGKGIYPYNYMTSMDKLKDLHLPSIDKFHNKLTNEELSESDYDLAITAWREFNCRTMLDYTLAYLKLDIMQLADVFEAFRKIAIEQDGLDPLNFCGIPGLSWCSAFKMTDVEVDLLQDTTMYQFFERGIRGGCCFVNEHQVTRNSPEDKDYNPNEAHTELLYIDANNLYGHALSMSLPKNNFQWINDETKLRSLIDGISSLDDDGDIGYVFEVDLIIPPDVQDLSDDFPFAPETQLLDFNERCTRHMRELLHETKSPSTVKKLLLTHEKKENYIVHFALLKFYIEMGVQVDKIHSAVQFSQEKYLKPYILHNSLKRAESNIKAEQDYFKLKNNSVYGKSLENVRGRRDIKIVNNNEERFVALSSRATFLNAKMFADDLFGVELLQEKVILDKPLYIGFSVLELSKLVMYRLRYNTLPKYEKEFNGTIRISGGDTDSFFLRVQNISLRNQLIPSLIRDEILDTSNYQSGHMFHSNKLKAKLGCVKDEGCGEVFKQWILLRPKCYSMLTMAENEHKRAKGVQRCIVKNVLRHEDYVRVARDIEPIIFCENIGFRSTLHKVTTSSTRKRALTMTDDKRAWYSSNKSYAYGHHRLQQLLRDADLHVNPINEENYSNRVDNLYYVDSFDDGNGEEDFGLQKINNYVFDDVNEVMEYEPHNLIVEHRHSLASDGNVGVFNVFPNFELEGGRSRLELHSSLKEVKAEVDDGFVNFEMEVHQTNHDMPSFANSNAASERDYKVFQNFELKGGRSQLKHFSFENVVSNREDDVTANKVFLVTENKKTCLYSDDE